MRSFFASLLLASFLPPSFPRCFSSFSVSLLARPLLYRLFYSLASFVSANCELSESARRKRARRGEARLLRSDDEKRRRRRRHAKNSLAPCWDADLPTTANEVHSTRRLLAGAGGGRCGCGCCGRVVGPDESNPIPPLQSAPVDASCRQPGPAGASYWLAALAAAEPESTLKLKVRHGKPAS